MSSAGELETLKAALVAHNDLLRSAFQAAQRDATHDTVGTTNYRMLADRADEVLSKHQDAVNAARHTPASDPTPFCPAWVDQHYGCRVATIRDGENGVELVDQKDGTYHLTVFFQAEDSATSDDLTAYKLEPRHFLAMAQAVGALRAPATTGEGEVAPFTNAEADLLHVLGEGAALMAQPDEPEVGFFPFAAWRNDIWDAVARLRREDRAVLPPSSGWEAGAEAMREAAALEGLHYLALYADDSEAGTELYQIIKELPLPPPPSQEGV